MADLKTLRRPTFFAGQLLTAEDLLLEQNYFRDKLKRHNQTLHGFGIVTGLRVSKAGDKIVVEAGLALDCEGNELVVTRSQSPIPLSEDSKQLYVNVRYLETAEVDTSQPGAAQIIVEGVKIHLAPENCNRNHRHSGGRWLACGIQHDLTIAKLRREKSGWRVDRRYRPPAVK